MSVTGLRVAGLGQITDYLFISSRKTAEDGSALIRFNITCIINATQEPSRTRIDSAEYVQVPVADSPEALLQEHFDSVSDQIKRVREQTGRVLVHCNAGVSRSAALCIAYLIKHCDRSLLEAHRMVKACRPIIRPNNGFWEQLMDYERSLRGFSSVVMVQSPLGPIPDLYEQETRDLIPV